MKIFAGSFNRWDIRDRFFRCLLRLLLLKKEYHNSAVNTIALQKFDAIMPDDKENLKQRALFKNR